MSHHVMTPEDLAAAHALVDATTDGTWKAQGIDERGWHCVLTAPGDGTLFSICSVYSFEDREQNAVFIAASRDLVRALLAEVDRRGRELLRIAVDNERLISQNKLLTELAAGHNGARDQLRNDAIVQDVEVARLRELLAEACNIADGVEPRHPMPERRIAVIREAGAK